MIVALAERYPVFNDAGFFLGPVDIRYRLHSKRTPWTVAYP